MHVRLDFVTDVQPVYALGSFGPTKWSKSYQLTANEYFHYINKFVTSVSVRNDHSSFTSQEMSIQVNVTNLGDLKVLDALVKDGPKYLSEALYGLPVKENLLGIVAAALAQWYTYRYLPSTAGVAGMGGTIQGGIGQLKELDMKWPLKSSAPVAAQHPKAPPKEPPKEEPKPEEVHPTAARAALLEID